MSNALLSNLFFGSDIATTSTPSGIDLYWRFDEPTGSFIDEIAGVALDEDGGTINRIPFPGQTSEQAADFPLYNPVRDLESANGIPEVEVEANGGQATRVAIVYVHALSSFHYLWSAGAQDVVRFRSNGWVDFYVRSGDPTTQLRTTFRGAGTVEAGRMHMFVWQIDRLSGGEGTFRIRVLKDDGVGGTVDSGWGQGTNIGPIQSASSSNIIVGSTATAFALNGAIRSIASSNNIWSETQITDYWNNGDPLTYNQL